MKTTFATALLTIAFLSAGAFANGNNGNQGTTKPLASLANETIVIKNQAWPVKGMMTVEPCAYSRCVSI